MSRTLANSAQDKSRLGNFWGFGVWKRPICCFNPGKLTLELIALVYEIAFDSGTKPVIRRFVPTPATPLMGILLQNNLSRILNGLVIGLA
jgi:hypothetical protein